MSEDKGIKIALTGIDDVESINKFLDGVDIVFHLAAAQHEMNIQDKVFWDVNVEGTRNSLNISVKNKIKRLYSWKHKIDENSSCNPDNIF